MKPMMQHLSMSGSVLTSMIAKKVAGMPLGTPERPIESKHTNQKLEGCQEGNRPSLTTWIA